MKMFDIKKFLIENKLTEISKRNSSITGNKIVEHIKRRRIHLLNEAGYIDDAFDDYDDEWTDDDEYVKQNTLSSKELFGKDDDFEDVDMDDDSDLDSSDDFEDVDMDDDSDLDSSDDFEDVDDNSSETGERLVDQLNYDPEKIEFEMSDDELENYLQSFRRPDIALKTLQRALRSAQREINEYPTYKKLYLLLQNGFYKTSAVERGRVIATIRR